MQNQQTVAWHRKSVQHVLLLGVLVASASCTPDTSTPTSPMSGDAGIVAPDSAANEPDTQSAADATTLGPDITLTDTEADDTTTVVDDIATVMDAITDSGVADEVTAPVDPCESVGVLDEDAIYSWFESDIYPLLAESPGNGGCASCHSPGSGNGMIIWPDPALTLQWLWADGYFSTDDSPDTLPYVLKETAPIQMPYGGPYWTDAQIALVANFVCALNNSGLSPPAVCDGESDPGNVLLRRISNYEYNRTVAAVVEDKSAPGDDFPADGAAYGFDNVASAQSLTAGRFEKYHTAAHTLAQDTLYIPTTLSLTLEAESEPIQGITYNQDPVTNNAGWGGPKPEEGLYKLRKIRAYLTPGQLNLKYPGTYRFTARIRGFDTFEQKKNEAGEWEIIDDFVETEAQWAVGSNIIATTFAPESNGWFEFEATVMLEAGLHEPRLWLSNVIFYGLHQKDTALDVDWLAYDGPLEPIDYDVDRVEKFFFCTPLSSGWEEAGSCEEATVSKILTNAWRRPPTDDEVARYLELLAFNDTQEQSFKDGVELVLEAALMSPHFLFRPEVDPVPEATAPHPLAANELATRLSYFIWSSPPDATLRALAESGALLETATLEAEIDRLLDDPRADALVENFASQWLQLSQLNVMAPNAEAFPEFTPELREAMRTEIIYVLTNAFFADTNLNELIVQDTVYANKLLATHYGLDWPAGASGWTELSPGDTPRGGLLFSAGLLTLTSHAARTSPTKRGKWLLEQLLCQPPEDPPGDVDMDVEPPENTGEFSVKEVLAMHAEDPACAGCHVQMDGLGMPLEHFDPLGRWRVIDDFGMAVDPTMTLDDGTVLDGPDALASYLKSTAAYPKCVTQKMVTYALGRDPQVVDPCALSEIESAYAAAGYTLRGLVKAIALHPMFRQRRPAKPDEYEYLALDPNPEGTP